MKIEELIFNNATSLTLSFLLFLINGETNLRGTVDKKGGGVYYLGKIFVHPKSFGGALLLNE